MEIALIDPDDPRWSSSLGVLRHDIYHLPEYVQLLSDQDGGSPVAVCASEGDWTGLIPLIIRRIPEGLGAPRAWKDAISPYGYPAPIVSDGTSPEMLTKFMSGVLELCTNQNFVSLFLRSHPFLGIPAVDLQDYGEIVTHGRTVFIDIQKSQEEINKSIRKGHRYEIRRLISHGYVSEMDNWQQFEEFVTIYMDTMRRVSADKYYMFSSEYFPFFKEALGDQLHICTIRSPEGEIAAAGLFSECSGIVQYLYSGTAEPYLRMAPTKLMLFSVIHWARELGLKLFHLGGGHNVQEDSLFQFKAGFSNMFSKFYTFRAILDEERYFSLVDKNEQTQDPLINNSGHFFPRYRIPSPVSHDNP